MSQFKTQGQKIKQNIKNDMYINDITNEEFDTYYQKCQERKYLKNISNTIYKNHYSTNSNDFDMLDNMFKESSDDIDFSEKVDIQNDYDEYPTNEEIDVAFEEAEKWSDF